MSKNNNGRKKGAKGSGKKMSLGKTLIKSRNQKKANRRIKLNDRKARSRAEDAETGNYVDYGGMTGLTSVTELSSLDEFISQARMADRQFATERNNVVVVKDSMIGGDATSLGRSESVINTKGASGLDKPITAESLKIPRRPAWTSTTTKEELDKAERMAFLQWRRSIAELEERMRLEDQRCVVTPFEKNIEFWRQLWRVMERSDLIVQIVDGRNPLMFYSPDLVTYAGELSERFNQQKATLLVVNKADYLTVELREQWAKYFDSQGIDFAFFSALDEQMVVDEEERILLEEEASIERAIEEANDLKDKNQQKNWDDAAVVADLEAKAKLSKSAAASAKAARSALTVFNESDDDEEEDDDDKNEGETKKNNVKNDAAAVRAAAHAIASARLAAATALSLAAAAAADVDDSKYDTLGSNEDSNSNAQKNGTSNNSNVPKSHEEEGNTYESRSMEWKEQGISENAKLMNRHQLVDKIDQIASKINLDNTNNGSKNKKFGATVGMVGYPNVGKSSVINVLLGVTSSTHTKQRVAVGATPGKTKHFQTLALRETLTLCDCPGLVFPSFVDSKAEMVCNGVLPISQLRDYMSPVTLICNRIKPETFESMYRIHLPRSVVNGKRLPYGARELLCLYATRRGYMRSGHSGPDDSRAARDIIKNYVVGKLLFCMPPPNSNLSMGKTSTGHDQLLAASQAPQAPSNQPRLVVGGVLVDPNKNMMQDGKEEINAIEENVTGTENETEDRAKAMAIAMAKAKLGDDEDKSDERLDEINRGHAQNKVAYGVVKGDSIAGTVGNQGVVKGVGEMTVVGVQDDSVKEGGGMKAEDAFDDDFFAIDGEETGMFMEKIQEFQEFKNSKILLLSCFKLNNMFF